MFCVALSAEDRAGLVNALKVGWYCELCVFSSTGLFLLLEDLDFELFFYYYYFLIVLFWMF